MRDSLMNAATDWEKADGEATRILQDLIRIDTQNPPGNELKVAEYLRDLFSREGLDSEILESAPGRATIVARIKGSGKKRPLLLLCHTDVVGVEKEKWTRDAFAGEIVDGHIYGRGAIDDKGMAAVCTETMLLLKRGGILPDRDVIFMAEADEEAGGKFGMDWVVQNHFDKIDAEVAINEGGRIMEAGGKAGYVAIQTTEKVSFNVKLKVEGHAGHASMPRPDNCIPVLSNALSRVSEYRDAVKLNPATRLFFKGVAKLERFPVSFYLRNLETPLIGGFCARKVSENVMFGACLRNTASPTIVKAGFRSNVIPASCEATLNVRLLPGESIEKFISRLEKTIGDKRVGIEYGKSRKTEPEASSFDNTFFKEIAAAAGAVFPGARVVPFMSAGATDSRELRARGMQAYGVLPFPLSEEDLDRMHGNDERVSVKSFSLGLRFIYSIVGRIAGA